jgi:hypothetical protein
MSLNGRDGHGRWEAECHHCSKILNLRTRNISTACERVIASGWAIDVTDDGDFVYCPDCTAQFYFAHFTIPPSPPVPWRGWRDRFNYSKGRTLRQNPYEIL